MTSLIQSGLLRTAACLLAILPVNAWAQAQYIQGGRGYATSAQVPVRINTPQSRGPNSPRVEESGPQPQGAQGTYRSRGGDGNYRGPDGNRGDRSNTVQPNNPNIADRGRQQTDGDGDRGRDGRSDYRRGRDGWASPRYDGRGRYDDYGRGGYARGGRFAGAYGGRYPVYRGWGWAQGGYASPVVVVGPVGYRGWARNYPFSTPIVVLPAYGGWAARPAYPINRRR